MSFLPNLPPSILARNAEASQLVGKKTKEDYKKMKELEEARKLATVPAMKDEEGNDINPHIPQYIMQAPWYYGSLQPTLRHQKMPDSMKDDEARLDAPIRKGVNRNQQAVKFRKGSCANCGSMTHKAKECLERPRKLGAKWTGHDIAPDEYIPESLKLGYAAKRDRWNGYDPAMHKKVMDRYEKLEEARKMVKSVQLSEQLDNEGEEDEAAEAEFDEDKYGDDVSMPGQKFDSKERQSIRNLRLREDTAKYLFNLNPNSAFYDPKTRSMRENPFAETVSDPREAPFAGDNFIRYQGDAAGMMKQQVFAWEMHTKKGLDLHLQADPTRLELLKKQLSEKEKEIQFSMSKELLDKYGGVEYLRTGEQNADVSALSQSENYVEYSRTGTLIRGNEHPSKKSRYEEDIFPLNHSSVWGSYWRDGQWGYKCCHSLLKNSYCTGDSGKAANAMELVPKRKLPEPSEVSESKKSRKVSSTDSSSSSSSSSDDSSSDSDSD